VRREAVTDLGTALRLLMDAAVRTEVPIEELSVVAGAALDLAARLREQRRELHEVASDDDPEIGERWYSPVHGLGNPLAPPMIVEAADGRSTGRVTLGKPHEGAARPSARRRRRHAAGPRAGPCGPRLRTRRGLTATLTVTYRRPVRLGVPLIATAEVTGTDGRRTTATARLVAENDQSRTLASAEGLFVGLRPDQATDVFAATGRDVGG
jgi:Thioesterase superfamily